MQRFRKKHFQKQGPVYNFLGIAGRQQARNANLSALDYIAAMNFAAFLASRDFDTPPSGLAAPVEALWWDAKGNWARAHELVDELETPDGMAVHAYLHRKEGASSNAEYWYRLAGRAYHRERLEDEWAALAEALLPPA